MENKEIEQLASIRLAEMGIPENDQLHKLSIQIWVNGYLESEKDKKLKDNFETIVNNYFDSLLRRN